MQIMKPEKRQSSKRFFKHGILTTFKWLTKDKRDFFVKFLCLFEVFV